MKVALDTIKQTNTNKPFSTIFQLEFGTVMYLLFFILLLHFEFTLDGGGQCIIQKCTFDGGGQCIIQKCTLDGGDQCIIQKFTLDGGGQ